MVNPTSPKPPVPKPAVSKPKPPVGVKPLPVQHDARGNSVVNWAAVTARHIALSASQVLRKLDHRGLSLEDTAALRGKGSGRSNQMPGGGTNPYENRPMTQSRHAPKNSTVIKGAGAAQGAGTAQPARRAAARPTSKPSARARSSWWQRLFRRG